MKAIASFIFATPLRSAIICGLAIAIAFGYFTHPDPELVKRASELTSPAFSAARTARGDLKQAYEAALVVTAT